jgi:hypothetical protein
VFILGCESFEPDSKIKMFTFCPDIVQKLPFLFLFMGKGSEHRRNDPRREANIKNFTVWLEQKFDTS